jgi:hypothetical protein
MSSRSRFSFLCGGSSQNWMNGCRSPNKRGTCRAAASEPAGETNCAFALRQGAVNLEGTSQADIAKTIKSYRRERRKPELTVVAEAVEATASSSPW